MTEAAFGSGSLGNGRESCSGDQEQRTSRFGTLHLLD